jgi:hypothetical protein
LITKAYRSIVTAIKALFAAVGSLGVAFVVMPFGFILVPLFVLAVLVTAPILLLMWIVWRMLLAWADS